MPGTNQAKSWLDDQNSYHQWGYINGYHISSNLTPSERHITHAVFCREREYTTWIQSWKKIINF